MSVINNALHTAITKRLEHLAWKCGGCEKVEECEEQSSPAGSKDYEKRYCDSLIRAAILEFDVFDIPFPVKGKR